MNGHAERVADDVVPVAVIAGEAAAPLSDAPPSELRGRPSQLLLDIVALGKPRLTALVVATMLGSIWIAGRVAPQPGRSGLTLALAVLGTVFVVFGANALNMYIERDTDRLMARTAKRPLPTGRMAPEIALAYGLIVGVGAVALLTFAVNAVTGLLAAIALTSYVLAYTPAKRRTRAAMFIGAIPGAIPPLLGWTAVTGNVGGVGLLLFGLLFFWQLPHSIAIATFRRDDYRRAGLKTMPVEPGEWSARAHVVLHSVALVLVTLLLVSAGVRGWPFLVAAVGLGGAFLVFAFGGLRRDAGASWARSFFFFTLAYLPLIFGALMVSV